jgi:hypothetical protein
VRLPGFSRNGAAEENSANGAAWKTLQAAKGEPEKSE